MRVGDIEKNRAYLQSAYNLADDVFDQMINNLEQLGSIDLDHVLNHAYNFGVRVADSFSLDRISVFAGTACRRIRCASDSVC